MSGRPPASQVNWSQDKTDFSREAFYSFLNDSSFECNTLCGSANQTCFKNCVSKSKLMIEAMRDTMLYSSVRERRIDEV